MSDPQLDALLAKFNVDPNKKETWFPIIILIVMVVVLYIYLLNTYIFSEMSSLSKKVPGLKSTLARMKQDLARRPRVEQELQTKRKIIEEHKRRLPTDLDDSIFFKEISAMAAETGVTIIAITPVGMKGNRETGAFQIVPMKINARGGYHSLGAFVNRIESTDSLKTVSSYQITADSKNGNHSLYMVVNNFISLGD